MTAKKAPSKKTPVKRAARKPPAVESIDERAELLELRTHLRQRLGSTETPASAVAALSKELRAVNAELTKLQPEEVSHVDALAARRAARRAGADAPASAARRSQPRRSGRSTGAG